ncbi:thioesterase II family protein [Streptomyces sp. NPDC004111]|uniref:thioesterase II family protein n=1 Tax=Streptomyces sp. NPDC004111 TaxID=3364690 RepID=UPI0036B9F3B4
MGDWITGWSAAPAGGPDDTGGPRGSAGPLPALVCVPPAGAGCGQFRAWRRPLAGIAEVYGVQLPAREDRWHEPMPDTFEEAVTAVTGALPERLGPGRPFVLYGHSFGGLLAYEVARRTSPYALVVSSSRPPAGAREAGGRIVGRTLGDDELDRLFDADDPDLDPARAAALRDETLREHMREMILRDARLSLTRVHRPLPLLHLPVHVWGAEGDTVVPPAALEGWAEVTSGPPLHHRVPGGHHAVLRRPGPLLDRLAELLRDAAAAPTAPPTTAVHTGA